MNLTFYHYPGLDFLVWLSNQYTRNDAIGDLARALRNCRHYANSHSAPWTLEGCHMYLAAVGMDMKAHEALEEAWTEWAGHSPNYSALQDGGE
jgi:hypothetical protein